ncbi:MAG: helix-turn-helix transcriptional regulator [Streptosporangiaceae bacterium]
MPDRKQPPTIRLRRFAAEILRLRKEAGLTREEVTEQTKINNATLYRLETARVRPQVRTVTTLFELYGVPKAAQDELLALLRDSAQRSWLKTLHGNLSDHYASYIGFEAEAEAVWNYESSFIPGLMQTEDYARDVITGTLPEATPEDIEALVSARTQRQAVLRREAPLRLWAIIDEAALRRRVGSSQVRAEQLAHLQELANLPNVTLQVIPFEAGAHPGMPGSFVVMKFVEGVGRSVTYIDSMAGDLFLEEEADVSRYTLIFEHLRAVALSPAASIVLIARCAAEGE